MKASADDLPVIVLSDYAMAFPSGAHTFPFMCLREAGFPLGMMDFVRALYNGSQVFINIDGEIIWLYEVFAGVLQGCPTSDSFSHLRVWTDFPYFSNGKSTFESNLLG